MPKRASASSTKGLFDSSDEDGSEEAPDCSAANGDSELRADSDANDDTERTSLTQVRIIFSFAIRLLDWLSAFHVPAVGQSRAYHQMREPLLHGGFLCIGMYTTHNKESLNLKSI